MKRFLLVLLGLGLVAVATYILLGRRHESTEYRFVTVERGTLESVVSSTGTLRATSTILVGTQVSGRVEAIYADFNDKVTHGQLIARIDPTLLEQEVRSAKTNVSRAEAELEHANLEMARAERLHHDEVITDTEYADARYQLALAKTSLEASHIALDKAERNLSYSEIHAPVDGIVLERNVEVGQTVAASLQAPQLFVIAGDLSQMEILALVDESDIGVVHPGQEARFTVQAFPDRTFEAKVRQVRMQSTVEENVVNYLVAVAVDNKDGKLLPGMTATIDFIVQRAEDILHVPNAALRFRPTDEMRAEIERRRNDAGAGAPDSTAARRAAVSGSGSGSAARSARRAARNANGATSGRGSLWVLDEKGELDVIRVQTGISDAQSTEIRGKRVTEGMQVIAAVTTTSSGTATNPFESRNQAPGRRRPGF